MREAGPGKREGEVMARINILIFVSRQSGLKGVQLPHMRDSLSLSMIVTGICGG